MHDEVGNEDPSGRPLTIFMLRDISSDAGMIYVHRNVAVLEKCPLNWIFARVETNIANEATTLVRLILLRRRHYP